MTPGTSRWREQLRFRDPLRSDRALRDYYSELKRRLAAAAPDHERYSGAKTAFVRAALDTAAAAGEP